MIDFDQAARDSGRAGARERSGRGIGMARSSRLRKRLGQAIGLIPRCDIYAEVRQRREIVFFVRLLDPAGCLHGRLANFNGDADQVALHLPGGLGGLRIGHYDAGRVERREIRVEYLR